MRIKPATIVFLTVLILNISCSEKNNAEFTDSPIIESYLNRGDYFNVKITRQLPFSSGVSYSADDIDNLTVQVTLNNAVHTLEPLGNGQYVDSSLIVSENDAYNLSFPFNSKNVAAYTYIPSKPADVTQSAAEITVESISSSSGFPSGFPSGGGTMPDPVKITWNNPDNSYYMVVVENVESSPEAIRDFGGANRPSNFFRKQPTNGASEQINSMEFEYYGRHRIIIYHVLPDYASLYEENNNTSSQNLTNPSTSITNGYGIFTGLNADTLWLEVKKQ
ncbi:MAG: hypothetical protein KF862_22855 [Chitinophagaceae bacterium]|nr:hypothetical protein [Chitinophagaceae bacterium]